MDSPFLQGNFAPVGDELSSVELTLIDGVLPMDLNGAFVRNGPNPAHPPRGAGYHWFEGEGMLHLVLFNGGRATYTNSWVRTEENKHSLAYGARHGTRYYYSLFEDLKGWLALLSFLWWRLLLRALSHVPRAVRRALALPRFSPWSPSNLANTNVIYFARRALALVESAPPTRVALPTLDTVGKETFGGQLKHAMTAHPRRCAATGELYFFAYSAEAPYCVVSSLDETTRRKAPSVTVPLPKPVMMHDFFLTRSLVGLLDLPVVFDKDNIVRREPVYQFDATAGARVGFLRRARIAACADGDTVEAAWATLPAPCFVFHVANAYEAAEATAGESSESLLIVLDVVRHERVDMSLARMARQAHSHADADGGRLVRWRFRVRFDAADDAAVATFLDETALSEPRGEFPIVAAARSAAPHRYIYYAARVNDDVAPFESNAVVKVDCERGGVRVLELAAATAAGARGGEFVHVATATDAAAAADAAEDAGYLVGFVYIPAKNNSELLVLEAASLRVCARLSLPRRVPHGFHGTWVSRRELAEQEGY